VSDDIIRRSLDLTHEVPTDRAVFYRQLKKVETVKIEAKMPGWLGGSTFKLTAQLHAGSPQNTAVTTLLLLATSCLIAGVASVIGVPALTALIIGLCMPISTYALVRLISGHWNR
jgi:hypothetical protein